MNNKSKQTDLLIITDNSLELGGGEKESQMIIINGASEKYKIAVIQPGEYSGVIPNVTFYHKTDYERIKYLFKRPFSFLSYIFKIGKLIKEIDPQIIHSNSQVSFFMVMLLRRFRRIPKDIFFIHTDRGLYTKYNKFFRWLFQFSFKYLDVLVTTTEFNKKSWKEANDKKGISLTYSVIGNTAGELFERIDESKIPNNDFITVGFAGRMCDWKGWPLAESICCEVSKKDSTARFEMYVVCLDKQAEIETEAMFERMRQRYGDRFFGRINVPLKEMDEFYYNIDVFVLTSWEKTESFGRTLVEAMSRKTAILTTDAGGAVEVVNNKSTVHSDACDFADHILMWKNNREVLDSEKERNYQRVREEYTLQKNLSGYLNLYASVDIIRKGTPNKEFQEGE